MFLVFSRAFTFNASFLILHFLDIDECTEGKDNCDRVSATCRNSPGGFACYCKPGYSRKDASSCERMLKLGRICARNVSDNNNNHFNINVTMKTAINFNLKLLDLNSRFGSEVFFFLVPDPSQPEFMNLLRQ